MIDLSIVVPYRNTPSHLLQRLLSSFPASVGSDLNWEVCIVDDASENRLSGTESYDESIIGSRGSLKIIRLNSHSGIGAARHVGFQSTSGYFITFVDSDDVLRPTGLCQMMQMVKENTVTFADHVVFPADRSKSFRRRKAHWCSLLEKFRGTSSCPFLFCNFIVLPTVISRSLLKRVGGYPNSGYAGEHVSFYGSLARQSYVDFLHLPQVVYEYWPRNNSHSLSNLHLHQTDKAHALIIEANKRGFQNWRISGIIVRRTNDAAVYLPEKNNKLVTPVWATVDIVAKTWDLTSNHLRIFPL